MSESLNIENVNGVEASVNEALVPASVEVVPDTANYDTYHNNSTVNTVPVQESVVPVIEETTTPVRDPNSRDIKALKGSPHDGSTWII